MSIFRKTLEEEQKELKYKLESEQIEKIVNEQFNKAKKIIGERLYMLKTHETMYNFFLKVGDHYNKGCYIRTTETDRNALFEITIFDNHYQKPFRDFKYKKIHLNKLSEMLIEWSNKIGEIYFNINCSKSN